MRAAEQWSRQLDRQELFSIEDMRKMQLSRDEEDYSSQWLRSDMHGNMNIVAISLHPPRPVTNIPLTTLGGRADVSREVLYRWRLVWLFCRFLVIRRRAILKKWWQTVDGALGLGTGAGRQVEESPLVIDDEVLQLTPGTMPARSRIPTPSRSQSPSNWTPGSTGIPCPPPKRHKLTPMPTPEMRASTDTGSHTEAPPTRLLETPQLPQLQDPFPDTQPLASKIPKPGETPPKKHPQRTTFKDTTSRLPLLPVNVHAGL